MYRLFKLGSSTLESRIAYYKGQVKASQKAMDELDKRKVENNRIAAYYPDLVDMYQKENQTIDNVITKERDNYRAIGYHLATSTTQMPIEAR